MIRDHEEVRRFLSDVCLPIKAREVHADIRRELLCHIEELTMERETAGFEREESIRWAVSQMGDPAAIGVGLHKVHRPRMNWGLLLAALGFVVLGIFAMYMFEISAARSVQPGTNYRYFLGKMSAVAAGLIVMGFFCFWDYRKLQRLSWPLYGFAVAGMLYTVTFGRQVNGSRNFISIGGLSIDWIGICPYLLVLAAAGILWNWRGKRTLGLSFLAFVIVPAFFFLLSPNLSALILYLAGYTAVYGAVSRRWFTAWLQAAGTLLAAVLPALLTNDYLAQRLTAYWNPQSDPSGAGYMALQMEKAIRDGGWWGQGFAAQLPRLPSIPNELVYVYLIHCFGWLAGAVVAVSVIYFIGHAAQSGKKVQEPFGKTAIAGMAALLGFQMSYSMLMSFGLVPLTGMPFPFVSYGGSHLLAELAAVGLMLGIYMRKDLIRTKRTEQPY